MIKFNSYLKTKNALKICQKKTLVKKQIVKKNYQKRNVLGVKTCVKITTPQSACLFKSSIHETNYWLLIITEMIIIIELLLISCSKKASFYSRFFIDFKINVFQFNSIH